MIKKVDWTSFTLLPLHLCVPPLNFQIPEISPLKSGWREGWCWVFFSVTFSLLRLISNCYMEMTKSNRQTVENQSLYHKQKVRILVKYICFLLSLACFLLVSPSCSSQIFFMIFSSWSLYSLFFCMEMKLLHES